MSIKYQSYRYDELQSEKEFKDWNDAMQELIQYDNSNDYHFFVEADDESVAIIMIPEWDYREEPLVYKWRYVLIEERG